MTTAFRGDRHFLSNFYPCRVEYDGIVFPSSEHAFQAAKTEDWNERNRIRLAKSPAEAKQIGRSVALVPGWDSARLSVMGGVLKAKFLGNEDLIVKLLATGDSPLVEENAWGDTFWGVCQGVGENNLGKLLMLLRRKLRERQGKDQPFLPAPSAPRQTAPRPPRQNVPPPIQNVPHSSDFPRECQNVLDLCQALVAAGVFKSSVEDKIMAMQAWSEDRDGFATDKMWAALSNMRTAVEQSRDKQK